MRLMPLLLSLLPVYIKLGFALSAAFLWLALTVTRVVAVHSVSALARGLPCSECHSRASNRLHLASLLLCRGDDEGGGHEHSCQHWDHLCSGHSDHGVLHWQLSITGQ